MPPTNDHLNERRFLDAARTDPAQFAPIFERYIDVVYRYCLLRLWNRERAEDATSQTFLKALDALDGYRGGSPRAWLFAIARTTVVDLQRRTALESSRSEALDDPGLVHSPEEEVLAAEDLRWLHAALGQLTEAQQQVVTLRLAGLTGAEIANVTGRTHGSIRALQYRAVAEMKRLRALDERVQEVSDE